ncbi:MAG: T9SS type A sorting domain-containing protein [Crocinitomicaceae bacterium]|nr:T9SS type A sorting domain-containing protein [Crocinitomicaceae bacterium]
MKKYILSFAILLLAATSSFAQDITITLAGGSTDIAGQIHTTYLTVYGDDMDLVDFDVFNNSGVNKTWVITRRIMNETPGWSNYFCWGAFGQAGNCYDAEPDEYFYSDTVTIVDGNKGLLWTYISAPTTGSALYRYYITSADSSSYEDSVDLQVNAFVGIDELSEKELSIFPNPSSSVLQIKADIIDASLTIADLTGRVHSVQPFNNELSINVAELNDGIYFVTVSNKNGEAKTERVLIHH